MKIKFMFFGALVGAAVTGMAFAVLTPTWGVKAVKPVVACKYDTSRGFIPVNGDPALAPSWNKVEVTPVVMTKYDSAAGFVATDGTNGSTPAWTKNKVQPWVEVQYNPASGVFEPK